MQQSRTATWGVALTMMMVAGALAGTAHADEIAVFSTGVDDAGNVLPPGTTDAHYWITDAPDPFADRAAVTEIRHPLYAWNDPVGTPGSAWIGPLPGPGDRPAGDYVYSTTFDLTGFEPSTAVITGAMGVDNTVEVFLNGVSTGITSQKFRRLDQPFTLAAGFVPGVNRLDFVVANLSLSPTGFRALLSGTADPVQSIDAGLDIRPWRASNRIRLGSRGVLLSAVLGSADFDVTDIDVTTVTLAGAGIATRCSDEPWARVLDVNDDGHADLLFAVRISDLAIDADSPRAALTATTLDGIDVTGSDAIAPYERTGNCWGWIWGRSREDKAEQSDNRRYWSRHFRSKDKDKSKS